MKFTYKKYIKIKVIASYKSGLIQVKFYLNENIVCEMNNTAE